MKTRAESKFGKMECIPEEILLQIFQHLLKHQSAYYDVEMSTYCKAGLYSQNMNLGNSRLVCRVFNRVI